MQYHLWLTTAQINHACLCALHISQYKLEVVFFKHRFQDLSTPSNNSEWNRKLINFMELRTSWEAASCAAIQELINILWNPKVHYRVHKSPPLVRILRHINILHLRPHSCYILIPSRPPWLDYSDYTWRRVQVMNVKQKCFENFFFSEEFHLSWYKAV
jgi:hypothetical protein